MTTRYAVANQKGGVAKTTNTINIGGALAHRGHDVLLVDADPQGHLSRTLGFMDEYNGQEPNLSDAIKEPGDYHIEDLIVSHPELDIVPSNLDMFSVQQDLIAAGWKPRERLSMFFEDLTDTPYDYVLIDAPPSLGVINDNVLLATQKLVVPVEPIESSIHALDILLNQIETLEDRYDTHIDIAAIVLSNVNYPLDNDQQENIDYFEDTFAEWCPVHEIRNRAAVKRSLGNHSTVFGADAEETDMADNYRAIAETLEVANE
jgi:chromosome partitioning protein